MFITRLVENQGSSDSYDDSSEMSCLTGNINYELESGQAVFDNTQVKTCGYGQTQCYKATITARVGNWPSKLKTKEDYQNFYCNAKLNIVNFQYCACFVTKWEY